MELYCFELGPIFVPMIETEDGQSVTTIKIAANALDMTVPYLHSFLWRFPERFKHRNLASCKLKEFMLRNRDIFCIECARHDLRLLDENDILELALLNNNWEFRDKFKEFLNARALRNHIRRDECLHTYSTHQKATRSAPTSEEDSSSIATQIYNISERLTRLEREADLRKQRSPKIGGLG